MSSQLQEQEKQCKTEHTQRLKSYFTEVMNNHLKFEEKNDAFFAKNGSSACWSPNGPTHSTNKKIPVQASEMFCSDSFGT